MAHSSDTISFSNSKGPDYYKRGKAQVWDFIRDNDLNFHLGNAVKYIARAGHKDSKKEDLIKAIHYLENELENTINTTATSTGVSEVLPYPQFKDSKPTFGAEGFNSGGVQGVLRGGGFTL
tara:strand:+ start:1339 stop:1701 length:363 start_codon:yes stop_codon:yes gene_type:complete